MTRAVKTGVVSTSWLQTQPGRARRRRRAERLRAAGTNRAAQAAGSDGAILLRMYAGLSFTHWWAKSLALLELRAPSS